MNRIEIDDDGQTVRVYPSRWGLLRAALCFIALGLVVTVSLIFVVFLFAFADDSGGDGIFRTSVEIITTYVPLYFVGGLGLLAFGIIRLARQTPTIEMAEAGIAFLGQPRIAWKNIPAIRVHKF